MICLNESTYLCTANSIELISFVGAIKNEIRLQCVMLIFKVVASQTSLCHL